MSAFDTLMGRNQAFADTGGHVGAVVMPTLGLGVVTCLDPRVDPASFLGLQLSEAMVLRNAGGRVTDRVVADLSFTTFLGQLMGGGAGIEIAVVHHTGCGTGFLADEGFLTAYAEQTGFDAASLAEEAVTDPEQTVRTDTALLLQHPLLPDPVLVSGHVYDIETGLVRTVISATRRGETSHVASGPSAGGAHPTILSVATTGGAA